MDWVFVSSQNSYVKALTPNVFIWSGAFVCMCAKSLQLCLTLCYPTDCRPPLSSVHGILQARILEWVAVPSSRGSCWPRNRTHVSISPAGRFFTTSFTWGGSMQNHRIIDELFIYKSSTGMKTIKTNISTHGPVLYIFQRKYQLASFSKTSKWSPWIYIL